MMFKIGWNGRRYYAVWSEYGPYRDVFQAQAEAERLNRLKFGPSERLVQRNPKDATDTPAERIQ